MISILEVLVPEATLDVTVGKKICIDGQWILTTRKGVRIAAFQSESDLVKWWMALQKMAGREGFVSQGEVALQTRAAPAPPRTSEPTPPRTGQSRRRTPAAPAPPRVPEAGASPPWQSSGDGNSMRDWDFD